MTDRHLTAKVFDLLHLLIGKKIVCIDLCEIARAARAELPAGAAGSRVCSQLNHQLSRKLNSFPANLYHFHLRNSPTQTYGDFCRTFRSPECEGAGIVLEFNNVATPSSTGHRCVT